MSYLNKVVVVTGGASGIGLSITHFFASQGAKVFVLDVNEISQDSEAGKALSFDPLNGQVTIAKCDTSSWDDQLSAFKAIFQTQGCIDLVVANAGVSERNNLIKDAEDCPTKPDLTTLNVNLIGLIYTVKLAIHYISKNVPESRSFASETRGSIICTSSNAGIYPFPVAPLYATSKHGVVGLVRSLARPLAMKYIQINALAPAVLETNIAPDKALFRSMILTPMSTLIKAVIQITNNSNLTGQIAEVHGETVTMRPPPEYVDKDTEKNIENFWSLGYALKWRS